MKPYTSKYLLRRYLDPPNPPQTPSQEVLGGLRGRKRVPFSPEDGVCCLEIPDCSVGVSSQVTPLKVLLEGWFCF